MMFCVLVVYCRDCTSANLSRVLQPPIGKQPGTIHQDISVVLIAQLHGVSRK